MLEKILQWDREIFIYLNNLGINEFDGFWLTITKFTTWIPLFIILIIIIFLKNTREKAFWIVLSFLSMLAILTPVIALTKYWVERLRPNNNEQLNTLIRILRTPSDYSFFSGHAATSFSIATLAVLFLHKKFRWIHIIWIYPILFSLSRIYLGVHYPSDIIVGAMVGIVLARLFFGMYQKFKAPYL